MWLTYVSKSLNTAEITLILLVNVFKENHLYTLLVKLGADEI